MAIPLKMKRIKKQRCRGCPTFEYTQTRRIQYEDGATFVPICMKCGRYVKSDKTVATNDCNYLTGQTNATCKKCGRTWMLFEGYM